MSLRAHRDMSRVCECADVRRRNQDPAKDLSLLCALTLLTE